METSKFISKDLLENFVDFHSLKKQEIQVKVSTIKVNLSQGSKNSLDFLKATTGLNDEAFYTKFANFIDYKWLMDKWLLQVIAIVHLIYVVIIDVHALHIKEHLWNIDTKVTVTVLLIMTFLLWLYEFYQVKHVHGLEYITDVTNCFDLCGQICVLGYCFMVLLDTGSTFQRQVWYSVGLFTTNTRLLFHLSVFSNQFGMMLTIIVRACYDLINFMFILYFFVFIFGMCNFVVNSDKTIGFSLASAYQLIFGENLK